jgi:branched-chain amino acid transport system ATP-binding protein
LGNSLKVEGLVAGYGAVKVLRGVSITAADGETVALLGTNGNGKSTLIKCVTGHLKPTAGSMTAEIDGTTHDLTRLSAEAIVDLGIALVPEGRRLFSKLTVEENLILGSYRATARRKASQNLDYCYDAFPRLRERRRQLAGSMSGGEQQMLALARAIMSSPRILVIDEPSVGLAPIIVARMIEKIAELKAALGLTVLMAEQNFQQAIRIADRGYVLVHGGIAFAASNAEELRESDVVRKLYLGLD